MKGSVKFFDARKGFGFISGDDDHRDYFCHHTEIQMKGFKTLFENQRVEFDPAENDRGPVAKNIKKIRE